MSYKILTRNSLLVNTRILHWDGTGDGKVIAELGTESVDYIMSRLAKVWKPIKDSIAISGEEVSLAYVVDNEEVYISLKNTTSDVCDEWYYADITSSLFALSVMHCSDIASEVHDRWLRDNCKSTISNEELFDTKMKKNVLIDILYDAFVGHGFKTDSRSRNNVIIKSDVLETLFYIPKDNLELLVQNFYSIDDSTVTGFLNKASKLGYLSFKPYVTKNKSGTTTLVLKYNRFVHLFRGYNYQCSYTAEGRGTYSSAGIRIDEITYLFGPELRESRLLKMLYYMNLITCCSELDVFNKLLKTSPEVIDKFMKLSTKDIFDEYDIEYIRDMTDIFGFTSSEGLPYGDTLFNRFGRPMLPEPREVLRISANTTSDFCRLKVYFPDIIGLETPTGNMYAETLLIAPKVYDGYEPNKLEKNAEEYNVTLEEYKEYVSAKVFGNNKVYSQLVAYLLNSCGFVINYMATYPHDNTVTMRAMNTDNIKVLEHLGSLDVSRLGVEAYDKYDMSNITSDSNVNGSKPDSFEESSDKSDSVLEVMYREAKSRSKTKDSSCG